MRKYLLLAGLLAGCSLPISNNLDRMIQARKKHPGIKISAVNDYLILGQRAYVRLVTLANSEETSILEEYCQKADRNRDKEVTFKEVSALEKEAFK